jgi:hypothetical protein
MARGKPPGPASSLSKNNAVAIEEVINVPNLEAAQYYALPNANFIC